MFYIIGMIVFWYYAIQAICFAFGCLLCLRQGLKDAAKEQRKEDANSAAIN